MVRDFVWDDRKAAANEVKQGVAFPEARTIFADVGSIATFDTEHSEAEDRGSMAKTPAKGDEMRAEHDFSGGVRGKYAARYAKMGVRVTIDPDMALIFPDSSAVNQALRTLARVGGAKSPRPKAVRRKKAR